MSFIIILLGVLLSASLFALGFMSLVRQRRVLGIALMVLGFALFISMFFIIKDAPPIEAVS